jgi:Flp pilus assembly protein TadG
MRSRTSSFASDESGSSLIEFTLCVTLILSVVFGIMDISRALYTDHFVASAARQGARFAMVRGSTFTAACTTPSTANCLATQSSVSNYVKSVATVGTSVTNLAVATTWPGLDGSGAPCTNAVKTAKSYGCIVTVRVTYTYHFIFPFLPTSAMALASTSSMTISQ